jgi:hypothetical protein
MRKRIRPKGGAIVELDLSMLEMIQEEELDGLMPPDCPTTCQKNSTCIFTLV